VTLSDLAKYSVARSIARPLCNSWASCYSSVTCTFSSKILQKTF